MRRSINTFLAGGGESNTSKLNPDSREVFLSNLSDEIEQKARTADEQENIADTETQLRYPVPFKASFKPRSKATEVLIQATAMFD